MNIVVRECGPADAARLARLRADFLEELGQRLPSGFVADLEDWFAQALGTPRVRAWVAEAEGEIAGTVVVNPFERVPNARNPVGRGWYLMNVYTLAPHRGRGIAKRLLAAVDTAAAQAGVPALELRATDEGRPLYERFGFGPSPHYMERMETSA